MVWKSSPPRMLSSSLPRPPGYWSMNRLCVYRPQVWRGSTYRNANTNSHMKSLKKSSIHQAGGPLLMKVKYYNYNYFALAQLQLLLLLYTLNRKPETSGGFSLVWFSLGFDVGLVQNHKRWSTLIQRIPFRSSSQVNVDTVQVPFSHHVDQRWWSWTTPSQTRG